MFNRIGAAAAAILVPLVLAAPAQADSAGWTGPNGGSVTRDWSYGGGTATGSVNRTGPNGGSSSATWTCTENGPDRCRRDYSYTNPAGDTWSGSRGAVRGPFRNHTYGAVTTPSGDTYFRHRVRAR